MNLTSLFVFLLLVLVLVIGPTFESITSTSTITNKS